MTKKSDIFDRLYKKDTGLILGLFDDEINKLDHKVKIDNKGRKWITYGDMHKRLVTDGVNFLGTHKFMGEVRPQRKSYKIKKKTFNRILRELEKYNILENIPRDKGWDNRSWWSLNPDWNHQITAGWQHLKIQQIRVESPEKISPHENFIIYGFPFELGNDPTQSKIFTQLNEEFENLYLKIFKLKKAWIEQKLVEIWNEVNRSKLKLNQKYILRQLIIQHLPKKIKLDEIKNNKGKQKIPPDINNDTISDLVNKEQSEFERNYEEITEMLKDLESFPKKKQENQKTIPRNLLHIIKKFIALTNITNGEFRNYKDFIEPEKLVNNPDDFNKDLKSFLNTIFDFLNENFRPPLIVVRPPVINKHIAWMDQKSSGTKEWMVYQGIEYDMELKRD